MERFNVNSILFKKIFQSAFLFFVCICMYAQSDPLIKIKLSGVFYTDETFVRIKNGTTTNFDFDWDAYKIMSGGTTPSIYTFIGNTNYSINSIPNSDSLPIIKLGVHIQQTGLYTMVFANSRAFHNYTLVDNELGITILVDSSSVYSFTGVVGQYKDRFELHYNSSQPFANLSLGTIYTIGSKYRATITSTSGGIVVKMENATNNGYQIDVFDMGGQRLQTIMEEINTSTTTGQFIELSNVANGNYLVKLTQDDKINFFQVLVF